MPNEITKSQKTLAGFLLIVFTGLPIFFIIAFWPNRLPDPKGNGNENYHFKFFHVALVNDNAVDSIKKDNADDSLINTLKIKISDKIVPDTSKNIKADSAGKIKAGTADSISKLLIKIKARDSVLKTEVAACTEMKEPPCVIHINTILLILVALAGFLGNMIHIATSFTTFIGAEKFKASWILWYYVKPFSAAALAIGLYFVFRGGFLNMSDGSGNINLYGVMTLSLLAGLFTDKATQKLQEIFEVAFRSKEERPNPLKPKPKVTSVTPLEIEPAIDNILTLAGEELDAKKMSATINDTLVSITDIDTNKTSASVKYKIPDAEKDTKTFILLIKDDEKNVLLKETLKLKEAAAAGNVAADDVNKPAVANEETGDEDDNDNAGSNAEPIIKE